MMLQRSTSAVAMLLLAGLPFGCITSDGEQAVPVADGGIRDGGHDGGIDGGPERDSAIRCSDDDACQNGSFCDGRERCSTDEDAGDIGCLPAIEVPCKRPEFCNEEEQSCSCDVDGDGYRVAGCGELAPGEEVDCDDRAFDVNPLQQEVCDAEGRNEDCDPSTPGWKDSDGDGYGDRRCWNKDADGNTTSRGDDCEDDPATPKAASIHPKQADDTCNDVDDDCNDLIDDRPDDPRPYSGCECERGAVESCGQTGFQIGGSSTCKVGRRTCDHRRHWGPCEGAVSPAEELCNGAAQDEDCDGRVDEGYTLKVCHQDKDGDGYAGQGAPTVAMVCPQLTCPEHSTSRAPGAGSTDCSDDPSLDPVAASRNPMAGQELCNGVDDDCNGLVDQADPRLVQEPTCPATTFVCAGAAGWRVAPAGCPPSSLDCDGKVDNCCEIPIDSRNCHACGRTCLFACGRQSCDDVADLSAGHHHVCALTREGQISCWGSNEYGQLGNGSRRSAEQPRSVTGLGVAHRVIAGIRHTCAISGPNREVYCWGANGDGQLGAPPLTDNASPVKVRSTVAADGYLSGVDSVAVGDSHSCAVTSSGKLLCWGRAGQGRLANAMDTATTMLAIPTAVATYRAPDFTEIEDAEQVVSGADHSCVLFRDRTVGCWGDNRFGQVGSDPGPNAAVIPVPGLTGVDRLAAGPYHTCALLQGKAWCWGDNQYGQLGRLPSQFELVPAPVDGLTDIVALAAGWHFTCALRANASVYCWGSNSYGERGPTSAELAYRPAKVELGGEITAISTGGGYACALDSTRQLWCWGQNEAGQLGKGPGSVTTAAQATPTKVFPLESLQ